MIKKLQKNVLTLSILLLPSAALARLPRPTGGGKLEAILDTFSDFFDDIIIFLMLLATAVFLWGIIKYLTVGGDEEKIKEARRMIIWGIVFLAVMVAVWGFVNIVLDFIFGTGGFQSTTPSGPSQ